MSFPWHTKTAAILSIELILLLGTPAHARIGDHEAGPPTRMGTVLSEGEFLPTGKRVTPDAAPHALFQALNPGLPSRPDFLADHAVDTAVSPDGKTLLILTSGSIMFGTNFVWIWAGMPWSKSWVALRFHWRFR